MNKTINFLMALGLLFMSSLTAVASPCDSLKSHENCCCAPAPVVELDSCCSDEKASEPLQKSCTCSFEASDTFPLADQWQGVPASSGEHLLLSLSSAPLLFELSKVAFFGNFDSSFHPHYGWALPVYRVCARIRC